jgi:hypothetical protein
VKVYFIVEKIILYSFFFHNIFALWDDHINVDICIVESEFPIYLDDPSGPVVAPVCPNFVGHIYNETDICCGLPTSLLNATGVPCFYMIHHTKVETTPFQISLPGYYEELAIHLNCTNTNSSKTIIECEDCYDPDLRTQDLCGTGNNLYCNNVTKPFNCTVLANQTFCSCNGFIRSTRICSLADVNALCCANVVPAFISARIGTLSTSINTTSPVVLSTISLYAELNGKEIIISSDTDMTGLSALLRKQDYAEVDNLSGFRFVIKLPRIAFIKSGVLRLQIFNVDGTNIFQKDFELKGISICELVDCIWCKDTFNNFSCLPDSIQTFLILFFVFLGLLILALFKPVLLPIVTTVLSILLGVLIWVLRTFVNLPKSNFGMWLYSKASSSVGWLNQGFQPVDRSGMLLLLIFLPLVLGCDKGLTIPVDVELCSMSGNIQTCKLTLDSTVSIPNIEGTACLTFINKDDPTDVVQDVQIKYVADTTTIDLIQLYETSAYDWTQKTFRHCLGIFGSSNHKCSTKRIAALSTTDRTLGGELKNPLIINRKGESIAKIITNTADCLSQKNCVFSGYGISPVGPIFTAYSPGTIKQTPLIEITVKQDNIETIKFLKFGLSSAKLGDLTFTVVGQLSQPQVTLDSRKIFVERGQLKAFLANGADQDIVTGFTLGAIQAETANDLLSPTDGSYSASPDIVLSQIEDADSVAWNFVQYAIPISTFFPTIIGGNLINYNNGRLESNLTQSGPIIIDINAPNSYTISRTLSIVCPTFEITTHPSGCFDCSQGSVLEIIASSTCASGLVSISTDSPYITMNTKTVRLTETSQKFLIDFETSVSDNVFKLTLSSDGISKSEDTGFVAISDVTLVNETFIISNQSQLDASKSGGFSLGDFSSGASKWFDNIFKGEASWWHYLLFGLAVIAGLIAIVAFLPITLMFIFKTAGSLITSPMSMFRPSSNGEQEYLMKQKQV